MGASSRSRRCDYGGQSAELFDPSEEPTSAKDAARFFGTRKLVARTLRAIEGRYWENLYSSVDDFVAAGGDASSWDLDLLLPSYDIVVGGLPNEGAICGGDSGGPLLRRDGSTLKVVGVVSGYQDLSSAKPRWSCYDEITVYSALGPEAKHLVDAARACGGVTQAGACDGERATRCTRLEEGPPHVVRSDCGILGHVCSSTPREPVCAPACNGDADCDRLAPQGHCDVPTGRCTFAPRCADEGDFACVLCCFGQATDPFACLETCGDELRAASMKVVGNLAFQARRAAR